MSKAPLHSRSSYVQEVKPESAVPQKLAAAVAHAADPMQSATGAAPSWQPGAAFSLSSIDVFPKARVQPRLQVGAVDTPAEREADRIAEEIVSPPPMGAGAAGEAPPRPLAPSHTIQRASTGEGLGVDADFERRLSTRHGLGFPVPAPLRQEMGARLRADLGQVRLHTGTEAEQMNTRIGARAFTYGRDIYLGAGEYSPNTASGQKLLAHELAHTVQQGGAAPHVIQRLPQDALKEARRVLKSYGRHPYKKITWAELKRRYGEFLKQADWWDTLERIYNETPIRQPVAAQGATWEDVESQAVAVQDHFQFIIKELIGDTKASTSTFPKEKIVYSHDEETGELDKDEWGRPMMLHVMNKKGKLVPKTEIKQIKYSGVGPLKTKERSTEKAKTDYYGDIGRVLDVLRATLAYDRFDQLSGALKVIWEKQKELGYKIRRVKQTYFPVDKMLYGDIKLNIAVGDIGHVCEVQLNSRAMIDLKNEVLHELYDQIRSGANLTDSYAERDLFLYGVHQRVLKKAHHEANSVAQKTVKDPAYRDVIDLAMAMQWMIGNQRDFTLRTETRKKDLDVDALRDSYRRDRMLKKRKTWQAKSHVYSPQELAELKKQTKKE